MPPIVTSCKSRGTLLLQYSCSIMPQIVSFVIPPVLYDALAFCELYTVKDIAVYFQYLMSGPPLWYSRIDRCLFEALALLALWNPMLPREPSTWRAPTRRPTHLARWPMPVRYVEVIFESFERSLNNPLRPKMRSFAHSSHRQIRPFLSWRGLSCPGNNKLRGPPVYHSIDTTGLIKSTK